MPHRNPHGSCSWTTTAIFQPVARVLSSGFQVVEMLSDGANLRSALGYARPDVIVLDIELPGLSGIDLARQLTLEKCRIPVVFLTVHADADYARAALDAGGLGYVVKLRLGTDLVPALRAALAGQRFISPCPELQALAQLENGPANLSGWGNLAAGRKETQRQNQIDPENNRQ